MRCVRGWGEVPSAWGAQRGQQDGSPACPAPSYKLWGQHDRWHVALAQKEHCPRKNGTHSSVLGGAPFRVRLPPSLTLRRPEGPYGEVRGTDGVPLGMTRL